MNSVNFHWIQYGLQSGRTLQDLATSCWCMLCYGLVNELSLCVCVTTVLTLLLIQDTHNKIKHHLLFQCRQIKLVRGLLKQRCNFNITNC